ncbi:hypothetical protein MJO28_006601 [Puccinia striiformis f. sp. tritici]|uniref:Uncharacterized protein n=1 Tax=Puccinia striiformis f. sp. tritici TaxID=168172 RepID=A0ACC0EIW1_9BASI|nr:hypothetical protein MJO28_006601 [Puccinia striiformis f. sp. tritici]
MTKRRLQTNEVTLWYQVSCLLPVETPARQAAKTRLTQGVESIVGAEVTKNANSFLLCQKKLVDQILQDHWDKISVTKTPLPLGYTEVTNTGTNRDISTPTKYLSLVGSISYLIVGTRPDLA